MNHISAAERQLESELAPLRERLAAHPLYAWAANQERLPWLLRSHVFCVWDFQSLLKSLQRELTCVTLPWLPNGDPNARRLINEIVLEEESDDAPWGGYCSHFELYVRAMQQAHADTAPIQRWLDCLRGGTSPLRALERISLPAGVGDFLQHTFSTIEAGDTVQIAATFTYGREELIPLMFSQFVRELDGHTGGEWRYFSYYLERHIESDGERHGPMSQALVRMLCGDDGAAWARARQAATAALRARLGLWDAIVASGAEIEAAE